MINNEARRCRGYIAHAGITSRLVCASSHFQKYISLKTIELIDGQNKTHAGINVRQILRGGVERSNRSIRMNSWSLFKFCEDSSLNHIWLCDAAGENVRYSSRDAFIDSEHCMLWSTYDTPTTLSPVVLFRIFLNEIHEITRIDYSTQNV